MVDGLSTRSTPKTGKQSPSPVSSYFPRRLALIANSDSDSDIEEDDLLVLPGNKVVVGEPGMGKTELMQELARRLAVEPVTAMRFITSKSPGKLVPTGKPLLIDALDEVISRREGDAIDEIFAQLDAAGAPEFILSCRSREWQARGVTVLARLYGVEPNIVRLEPFDREDAREFLCTRYPGANAEHVLGHLAKHSLEELHQNPLTLSLMGWVAEKDALLPATRAALFERVCALVWPEHDSGRQHSRLAQLSENDALNSAGAIAAALLLSGAEAISIAGAAQVQEGDLRLADVLELPKATAAREIFHSKLFMSVGQSRAKLMHRVIAEYLGARWLAQQAITPRAQRRLLSQFHGGGAVPASLRGLHAWLAYHSQAMAERVISNDPYGVLRYGEVPALTPQLAGCLLEALAKLAEEDPYFRAADWDPKIAGGLMIPHLKFEIEAIIGSVSGSLHLRTLLLEALKGSLLAVELADTLEKIVRTTGRSFRERSGAASALLPHRDRTWWRSTIEMLVNEGGEDEAQLASQLIQHIDIDVSDDLLVAAVCAEMALTRCPFPRRPKRTRAVGRYDRLVRALASTRVIIVLDLITEYAEMVDDRSWERGRNLAQLVILLLQRGISSDLIGPAHASKMWRWLGIIERANRSYRSLQENLDQLLSTKHELRRAIQTHVMKHERRPDDSMQAVDFQLSHRMIGLSRHPGDLVCAFNRLALGNNNDPNLRRDWRGLVALGWGPDGLDPEARDAAEAFRRGDKPLGEYLRKIANPKQPAWATKEEKEAKKRGRKRSAAFEAARRNFGKARHDLLAGELEAIFRPAQAYFDEFADLSSELSPSERIAEWIGPALRDDALVGFEAVLQRHDLPSPSEVAKGFAQGQGYSYSYAIMAGLYERVRNGHGVTDLSMSLKTVALLHIYEDHVLRIEEHEQALREALEADVLPTSESRKAFARVACPLKSGPP